MRAKLDFGAEIDILSGGEFNEGISKVEQALMARAEGLKHVRLPILSGNVTAGGAIMLGSQGQVDQTLNNGTLCGPHQGFVWQVTRLSVYGLQPTEELALYWSEPRPSTYVGTFSGSGSEWDSSHGLLLNPGDHLVLVSVNTLTAAELITVSGEALQAPADQIYKLIGG